MLSLKNISPILECIVSFIEEGVIIADMKGKVLYHNPAAAQLLDQPVDRPITSLNTIGRFNFKKRLLQAAIRAGNADAAGRPSGKFVRFEAEIEARDGTRVIEFNSGLVTLGDGSEQLRLVLLSDRTEHARLQAVLDNNLHPGILTRDPSMQAVLARIHQVANTQAAVLLQGESGTGKTQLARMLHTLSDRADKPFVEVNCAAIPDTLIESELFGHVKGAFTGATQNRPGRFQAADGGTLFLDEISEVPLHLQAKLLRAIQEQAFEPVGSDRTQHVDIRIVSASNRSLRELVEEGRFRADLYYRLAVIPLQVPPLRERPGDILLLAQHFIEELAKRGYPGDVRIGDEARRVLMNYPWPGNVRELENAIEHGIICAVDKEIRTESLPQDITQYSEQPVPALTEDPEEAERLAIKRALAEANGSRSVAASLLGIDRTTLWRRMNKLGLR